MAKTKVLICPYCGETQPASDNCKACGGLFEPLSRQATHNAMGPWFIRDAERPYQPGCSYDTLTRLIQRGVVTKLTIVRGPTTKQFWTVAKRVGGIAHLLGYCHQCDSDVSPSDHGCAVCGAAFGGFLDRNYLGLPELRPMPWEESVTDYAGSTPPGGAQLTPGGSGSSGVSAFQTAGPGRISSFATNEELVGAQSASPPPTSAVAPSVIPDEVREVQQSAIVQSDVEPEAAVQSPVAPMSYAPAPVMSLDDSALRLARRRALQYQKTAQRLWIALALSAIVIVALATVIVKRGGGDGQAVAPTALTNNTKSTANGNQTKASTTNVADDSNQSSADGGAAAGVDVADDKSNSANAGSAATVETPSVDTEAAKFETMLKDAQTLTESAQDESRELAARIADYVQLIQLLKDVRVNAPASVRPANIAEQIEQADRELERLRLREFFP